MSLAAPERVPGFFVSRVKRERRVGRVAAALLLLLLLFFRLGTAPRAAGAAAVASQGSMPLPGRETTPFRRRRRADATRRGNGGRARTHARTHREAQECQSVRLLRNSRWGGSVAATACCSPASRDEVAAHCSETDQRHRGAAKPTVNAFAVWTSTRGVVVWEPSGQFGMHWMRMSRSSRLNLMLNSVKDQRYRAEVKR